LRSELAQEIWLKFGFQTNAEDLKKIETKRGGVKMKKTRSKNEVITNYLKQNVGQIITAKDVEQAVGISLPTFYNFLNSNRHFFKKTGTGKYTVLDPAMERAKEQGGV
jgi:DNA invertase Pin-like site-specific DNA recombinase